MEAKTKKLIVVLGVSALAITGGILAWRKWGMKPKAKNEDALKAEEEAKKKEAEGKGQSYTPPSAPDVFPIEYGKHNANAKTLQNALMSKFNVKISGAPSTYFGNNTYNALKEIGYDTKSVDKDTLARIVAGKYPASKGTISGGGTASDIKPKKGKLLFAKVSNAPIWKYDDRDKFVKYSSKDEQLGTISDIITEMAGTADEKTYIVFGKNENEKKHIIRYNLAYVVA